MTRDPLEPRVEVVATLTEEGRERIQRGLDADEPADIANGIVLLQAADIILSDVVLEIAARQ